MKVLGKIAVALVICLLCAMGEAGAENPPPATPTPAPEETTVTVPAPPEAPEQSLSEPQLAHLRSLIREHGKTTQALDEEVRAIQQYVTGGVVALPLLLLLAAGLLVATLRHREAPKLDAAEVRSGLQDLQSGVTSASPSSEELGRRIERMEKEAPRQVEQLGELSERFSELEKKVAALPSAPPDLVQDLASFKDSVDARLGAIEAAWNGSSPAASPIPLEREVLKEAWNKFRENKEVMAVLAGARDGKWKEIREPLLRHLPQFVPDDLKPTFEAAVASAKDFHALTSKIGFVSRLVEDDNKIPPLPSEAQELMRLRELTSLLTMIQTSNLLADRLNFRLEPWIADCFLGFADLFLQRYQKAQMEKRESQLQPGYEIVRQILKIADLEPVDLTLGVTRFDSARHIGRSTASDPSVDSGVILGVIRNGFIRGGQQVIRQPEVIVNRA